MAYNKMRREIMSRLEDQDTALATKVVQSQEDLATKLESYYHFEDDGGSLKNCADWQLLRARAIRAEEQVLEANRTLRKILIALGGAVKDSRPLVVDAPDAQIEHPVETEPRGEEKVLMIGTNPGGAAIVAAVLAAAASVPGEPFVFPTEPPPVDLMNPITLPLVQGGEKMVIEELVEMSQLLEGDSLPKAQSAEETSPVRPTDTAKWEDDNAVP